MNNERPKCRQCGLLLHAFNLKPKRADQRPQFIGYGFHGSGYFCTKSCGYDYACAILEKENGND